MKSMLVVTLGLFLVVLTSPAAPQASLNFQVQTRPSSTSAVTFIGETHFRSGPAPQKTATTFLRKDIEAEVSFDIPGENGDNRPARVKAAHVPTPSGNSIVSGSFLGFEGLTEFDCATFREPESGGNRRLFDSACIRPPWRKLRHRQRRRRILRQRPWSPPQARQPPHRLGHDEYQLAGHCDS